MKKKSFKIDVESGAPAANSADFKFEDIIEKFSKKETLAVLKERGYPFEVGDYLMVGDRIAKIIWFDNIMYNLECVKSKQELKTTIIGLYQAKAYKLGSIAELLYGK
jgi:hypothetical protein